MNFQNVKNQSEKEQDDPERGFVFDFLYYDARRVGSFLSQFTDDGPLSSLTRSEHINRSKSDSSTAEAEGGVPLVAKAKGNYTGNISTSNGETGALTYDPFWTNALSFLDFLEDRGSLCRDISNARIGQITLATGSLGIRDLRLIQKIFALPSITKLFQPEAPKQNRKERRRDGVQATEIDPGTQFGLEMLKLLPHGIQAELQSADGALWCNLNEADLIVDSSDLFLKHGVYMPGQWNVLGIVDALPTRENDESNAFEAYAEAHEKLGGDYGSTRAIAANGLGGFIDGVVPFSRILLGRRDHQYGITPLLIFRKTVE